MFKKQTEDPNGKMKARTQKIAQKHGMRIDRIQSKIYETGLAAFEKQFNAIAAGK